jgi:hypothetical protein
METERRLSTPHAQKAFGLDSCISRGYIADGQAAFTTMATDDEVIDITCVSTFQLTLPHMLRIDLTSLIYHGLGARTRHLERLTRRDLRLLQPRPHPHLKRACQRGATTPITSSLRVLDSALFTGSGARAQYTTLTTSTSPRNWATAAALKSWE